MTPIGRMKRDVDVIAHHLLAGGNGKDASTLIGFATHATTLLRRHGQVRRDLLTQVEIGTKTIEQLRAQVRQLTTDLATERAARNAEIPRETLVRIVRAAYESGRLAGGEAAELLREPVQAFMGRRWKVVDADDRIRELEADVARLTGGLRSLVQYAKPSMADKARKVLEAKP